MDSIKTGKSAKTVKIQAVMSRQEAIYKHEWDSHFCCVIAKPYNSTEHFFFCDFFDI